MNLFPELTINIGNLAETELPLYMEWAYDFENNCFLTRNGQYYLVSKNDALKIWVYKALKTARYRYQAYPRNYGSELEDEIIGTSSNRDVLESEIERDIQETLLVNPYIIAVGNFAFVYDGSTTVQFSVTTVYGTMEEEVVVDG